MPLKSVPLTLTNRGTKDLSIADSCFQFDFKQYSAQIVLELNGLTRRAVEVSGAETHLRVELVEARQKLFDVGTLQIGQIYGPLVGID